MKKVHKSCPSATGTTGATLLGIVNQDNTVGYISTPITVDESFLNKAGVFGTPELRFRFSNTCVEAGCRQWQGGKCGVITNIMDSNTGAGLEQRLPDCSIRSSCRWFHQEGAAACSFCPHIITNMLDTGNVTG